MSDKPRTSNDELNSMIDDFLNNGGEIVRLRFATEKDQKKASQRRYHEDKAISGSERSKDMLAREEARESTMVFSRTDRWRE